MIRYGGGKRKSEVCLSTKYITREMEKELLKKLSYTFLCQETKSVLTFFLFFISKVVGRIRLKSISISCTKVCFDRIYIRGVGIS